MAAEAGRAVGGGAGGGIAIMTANGFVEAEDDSEDPLTRAELLDLCRRRGRNSPTPGDAMTYGMLAMRSMRCFGDDQERADYAIDFIKGMQKLGGAPAERFFDGLFDADGTTRGIALRFKNLEEAAQRRRK